MLYAVVVDGLFLYENPCFRSGFCLQKNKQINSLLLSSTVHDKLSSQGHDDLLKITGFLVTWYGVNLKSFNVKCIICH